jgi:hypothetical protein
MSNLALWQYGHWRTSAIRGVHVWLHLLQVIVVVATFILPSSQANIAHSNYHVNGQTRNSQTIFCIVFARCKSLILIYCLFSCVVP